MRRNAGFTMTELMAVIGIILLIVSMATPNLISWWQKYRLGSAARQVLNAVEFSRLTAVREDADITLNFDFINNAYTVVNAAGETMRSEQLDPDIDLQNTGLGASVVFGGNGLPSVSGSIRLRNNIHPAKSVRLTMAGNARIE